MPRTSTTARHDEPSSTLHPARAPGKRSVTASLPVAQPAVDGSPAATVATSGAPLAPLAAPLAFDFGRVMGADFSSVRVGTDPAVADAGARAVTQGDEIRLSPSAPAPESAAGRELLGHELVHVVQQRGGAAAPAPSVSPGATPSAALVVDAGLEAEADALGARAAAGEAVTVTGRASGGWQPSPEPGAAPAATSAPATRVVEGGGGYVYEQHADGTIVILAGQGGVPLSPPKPLEPGDPVNKAITEEITAAHGPFPAATAPSAGDQDQAGEGAGSAAGGLIPPLDDIVAKVGATLDGIGQAISDTVSAIGGFLFGGSEPEAAPSAGAPDTGAEAPATSPEGTELPFFSQRDNETGKEGAETIGLSARVIPDKECNVTTLAMQLVGLAGDAATVNQETVRLLGEAGVAAPADAASAQPEDLILQLFIAWGNSFWQTVCNDPANKAFFPNMDVGVSFYAYYSDPSKNTAGYGWHQIGQCLAYAGQLYRFVAKTGASGFDEQKADGKGGLSHDPTDAEYYKTTLKPQVDAGAAVMLSTKLTGGHIVLLVGIDDEGIWINDPYGVKLGGPASNSNDYVRNNESSPKSKAPKFDTYAANLPVRFKYNADLLAIATDEVRRAEPVPNWGERNYYTFAEVASYQIGKWNSVLEKAPEE